MSVSQVTSSTREGEASAEPYSAAYRHWI